MDGNVHHGHDSDVKLKKIPSYSRSDLRIEVTRPLLCRLALVNWTS